MSGKPKNLLEEVGITDDDEVSLDDDLASVDDQISEMLEIDDDPILGPDKSGDPDDDDKAKGKGANPDDDDDPLDEIVFSEDEEYQGDGGTDGGNDDDFEDPQTSVEKRIQRERRLKTAAYKEVEDAQKIITQVSDEVRKAQVDAAKTRREQAQFAVNMLNDRESMITQQIALHKELGNDDKAEELQSQLLETRENKRTAETIVQRSPSDETLEKYRPELPQFKSRRGGMSALASDWMDNNPWFESNPEARSIAQAIDNAMAGEGIDKNSPRYFFELTRRVAKRLPDVEVMTHDGRRAKFSGAKSGGRKRGGSGKKDTTGGRAQARAPKNTKGKAVLTKADRRVLEEMGLDFTNKEHVKEYLANRVSG